MRISVQRCDRLSACQALGKGRPVRKLELRAQDGRLLGNGNTEVKPKPERNSAGVSRPERRCALRQIALAAQPDALVRFHLRHLEQRGEHVELVAPRYPREVGDGLCNEGRGLVRSALSGRIIGSRTLIAARGWPRSPARFFAQNSCSKIHPVAYFLKATIFESATLGRISQLSRY